MLFQNENGQQHEQLFIYITFTVALLNIFLSSSPSVAKDEWFLYEFSIKKKNKNTNNKAEYWLQISLQLFH